MSEVPLPKNDPGSRLPTPLGEAALLAAVRDSVIVTDLAGVVTFWNDGATRLFGWDAEEMLGRPLTDRLPPRERPAAEAALRSIRRGEEFSGEWLDYRKDGSAVWVDARVGLVRGPDGRPVGMLGVAHDVTERKRAEEALRASERRQAFLLRLSDALRPLADPFAIQTEASRMLCEQLGASRCMYCEVEGEGEAAVGVIRGQYVREGSPFPGRFPYADFTRGFVSEALRRGGPLVVNDAAADPRLDDGVRAAFLAAGIGGLVAVSLVKGGREVVDFGPHSAAPRRWTADEVELVREVAERTWQAAERARAEGALRESEARFRNLADNAPVGVWVTDAGGACTYLNAWWCRLTGQTPEEGAGFGWLDCVHPDDREGALTTFRAANERHEAFRLEYRLRRHDATYRWAIDSAAPRLGPSGEFLGYVGSVLDVTDERRQQEALRESEERHRIISQLTSDYSFALRLDPDGTTWLEEASGGFTRVTGYTVGEWNERGGFAALLHPDDQPAATQSVKDLAAGRASTTVVRLVTKGGQVRWLRTLNEPVRQGGRVARVVGAAQDITETRRLEEQLRQAQKMEAVGRLAGGVAHGFNNLLTVITGYAEMLRESLGPDDPHTPVVAEIAKAAERAAELTAQLLAFGRKQLLVLRVLDLNALVRDVEGMIRRLVGEDVAVVAALQPSPAWVRADRGQLHQILLNLAANARDAMPQGGTLTIGTEEVAIDPTGGRPGDLPPGRYVRLTVSDSGVGMAPEALAHLFEPFFTTKGLGRGMGLGLSSAHGTVRQIGGEIEVGSQPGRGTTFRVYLPRAEPAERAADSARPRTAPPRGSESILLVEDEEGVRGVSRSALRAVGYSVVEAADAGEALRAWREHGGAFDLLVTDVVLPGESGRALAERLAAERPGLGVLFLSGHTEDAVLRRGVVEGEVHFLRKPFRPDELAVKVRAVLDRPGGG